jgi:hypothetical protein
LCIRKIGAGGFAHVCGGEADEVQELTASAAVNNGGTAALPPLPSAAEVAASIQGAGPKDTAARQEATFAVLIELIEHVTKHNMNANPEQDMPPAAARTWHEYTEAKERAMRLVIPKTYMKEHSSSESLRYFLSEEFRRQTLGRHVSPALVDSYESAHWAKEDAAAAAGRERHAQDQAAGETEKSLSKDVEEAKRNGVDLSVFGIQLGAQVKLPECPDASSDNSFGAVASTST